MGNSGSSVTISNGFGGDVWVKIDLKLRVTSILKRPLMDDPSSIKYLTERLSRHSPDQRQTETRFNTIKQAGFTRMQRGDQAVFLLPIISRSDKHRFHNNIFLISIFHFDYADRVVILHDCQEMNISKSGFIISEYGKLVLSSRWQSSVRNSHWIDIDGNSHKPVKCAVCRDKGSFCSSCVSNAKWSIVQKSLGTNKSCLLGKNLVELSSGIHLKNFRRKKAREGESLLCVIDEIALQYSRQEFALRVVVERVKNYAQMALDLAQDETFCTDELFDTATTTLSDCRKQLTDLKHLVRSVIRRSTGNAVVVRGKARRALRWTLTAEKKDVGYYDQACLMSIPIVGQVYTTYHCASSLTRLGVEMVDRKHISPPMSIPLKVVTGGLLGTAGAVAGCTVSLIHMPAGPFLWLHQLKTRMDLGEYTQLADHFSRIAFSMNLVDGHLNEIEQIVLKIEENVRRFGYLRKSDKTSPSDLRDQMQRICQDLVVEANSYVNVINKNAFKYVDSE